MITKNKKTGMLEIHLTGIKNSSDVVSIQKTLNDVIDESCSRINDLIESLKDNPGSREELKKIGDQIDRIFFGNLLLKEMIS
jgi:hypothetical protein